MKQNGLLTAEEFVQALHYVKKNTPTPPDPEKIKKRILFSITLLGIFSILAGIGLIIAANWAIIPPFMKVSGGLAGLAVSLVIVDYFEKNDKKFWKEAFLFISFMLIGGNIALVQQCYHLSLSWEEGSFFWWLLSLPLIMFTKHKLLPLCSVALLVFAIWDIVWDMNYMLVAGVMFVLMMLTNFFSGVVAKLVRELAFIAGIFCLYVGDFYSIDSTEIAGCVGVLSTTIFLILMLSSSKVENGMTKFYNYLFLLVAWRIFMLFWNAYYNLTSIGVSLVVFGSVLLTGAGLYTYYFKQIQNFIKGFSRFKENSWKQYLNH